MLSVWEVRKVRLYGEHANVHQSRSQNHSGDLRGVAGGDGVCVVRQAPVICVMDPPIHLGAWSMALMLLLLHTFASVRQGTVRRVWPSERN